MMNQLIEVDEQQRKIDSPSPEAIKLLKAFLMRTSVPRIVAQRIKERTKDECQSNSL